MKIGERFNDMINMIENTVLSEQDLKAPEIKAETARYCGLNHRDINTIFTYLTNYSLLDYIRERQIMAAYSLIVNMEVFDIEKAIAISGYDNQSSFGKKFKDIFGMSPKKAFLKKDKTIIEEPLTWERLLIGERVMNTNYERLVSQKVFFGISENQYTKMKQAMDLQALYELDECHGNLAFYVAEKYDIELKKAFELVADLALWEGFVDIYEDPVEVALKKAEITPSLVYVYFNVTKSIIDAREIIRGIESYGYDCTTIEPDIIKVFNSQQVFPFPRVKEIVDYYKKHFNDDLFSEDFDNFFDCVCCGDTLEEALSAICDFDYYDTDY